MSQSIFPPVAVEVIATVSGVIVSIGIPLVLTKLNKIDKLHTTVFGLQEVSTVGGLIETVQNNEEQVRDNKVKIEEIESNQRAIDGKIDRIMKYVKDEE
mgnify:CR=1 FL=1